MKTLVKWYKWILLAVMFQFCVLFYINNVFLNTDVTVSVTSSDVKEKPLTGEFNVPEGVDEIKLSYNARFGAYLNDGILHIVSVESKKDKKVAGLEKDKITYFKWLPDRDMVIYSSDTGKGKKGVVQMSTYEADSETIRDYPPISGLNSKSKVMDIDLSPFTNVVYAKINTSDSVSKIIRFNIMSQYAHVMNLKANAIIKECAYVNKLIYQNQGEAVYIYDGIKGIKNKVPVDAENARILDIDMNDTLFVGILDSSGKVTEIHSQKLTEEKPSDNWTKLVLKESVIPEDIKITGKGNIYINNGNENKIINASNDLKASYRGEFLEVLNGILVSKDANRVYINSLKEY